jgi:hypothetical protein
MFLLVYSGVGWVGVTTSWHLHTYLMLPHEKFFADLGHVTYIIDFLDATS